MENQRLLIWATFGMLLWMTYQAWVSDYGPSSAGQDQTNAGQVEPATANDGGIPALSQDETDAPVIGIEDAAPAIDTGPQVTAENAVPGRRGLLPASGAGQLY